LEGVGLEVSPCPLDVELNIYYNFMFHDRSLEEEKKKVAVYIEFAFNELDSEK
jgi:hypothetical protein